MNKKSMKKSLAIVLAMLLVCVISVAGTLAYLQASSGPVENTFEVGTLFDDTTEGAGLDLKEHQADYKNDGVYVLKDGREGRELVETQKNEYKQVLPGVDLPKDPFVRVKGLDVDSAYLFVEVVGLNNLSPNFSASVDPANWTVTSLSGAHGGTVYVYNTADGRITDDIESANILLDNVVEVKENCSAGAVANLNFYGYIIQAGGFADYTAAWNASGFDTLPGNN